MIFRNGAEEFAVSEKTIQRDFALLRDFLSDQFTIPGELIYSRKMRADYLNGKSLFNKNGALNKRENNALIDRLLALVSFEDKKEIRAIIASELLNYAPLSDQQDRIEKIWVWADAIREEKAMDIVYASSYADKKKSYTILPVSLYYDNHYFYLVVYNLKQASYITLRLDRILSWKLSLQTKPLISQRDRFKDGDVRNQRVDAFLGDRIIFEISFQYEPGIVLDQFPKSKITGVQDGWTHFQIESQYTPGLRRWLLGQADALKILAPQYLVDDFEQLLKKMLQNYK